MTSRGGLLRRRGRSKVVEERIGRHRRYFQEVRVPVGERLTPRSPIERTETKIGVRQRR